MLLSPSGSPAPTDSPASTSPPPPPPLPVQLPPLAAPPLFSPPAPRLTPAPAVAPVISPPHSPLPSPPPAPPEESTPRPPNLTSPPLPTPPAASGNPPLRSLPVEPPPLIPSETPPPPTSSSPPRSRRQPRPSLPPPTVPSSPLPPEPSPKLPLLPDTSPPPTPVSTTPFSASAPPQKPPPATLPFFGPSVPISNGPVGRLPPAGPVIVPKTSPGGFLAASPPQLLPLVPKSLPDTASSRHASTGLLFGGVIVGVLLLVLLGLLFICYRATRSGKNVSAKNYSSKPSKGKQRPQENAVPAGSHIITAPQEPFSPPQFSTKTSYSTGHTSGSVPKFGACNMNISSGTFTYDKLVEATNGFSQSNLLGQGGFGYVHKGVLSNGKEVAVKQLKIGSHQGEREFQAEVDTISRVHHKHLVSLVGYCILGERRLLVYEFVPNSTLEFHLHGNEMRALEWEMRLRIAVGAAKGLAYLHEDCNPTIIHRDIKAANILLDSNFEAKVSDFGLAKLFSDTNSSITHVSTRVVGTFGYMAPEYASSGKLTDKSDVYCFGVVLLELISGRPPIISKEPFVNESLVNWARPLLTKALEDGNFNALVDPNLQGNYDRTQMASMVSCASACIRQSSWLRPKMTQIVRVLEGEVSLPSFDENITPSPSTVYDSSKVSNYNTQKYRADMKRFKEILGDKDCVNGYSGSTSEFGLNPSVSTSDSRHSM